MSTGFSGGSSLIKGNLGSAAVESVSSFSGIGLPVSAVKIGTTIWQTTTHSTYRFVLLELDTTTQSILNDYPCTIELASSSSSIIDGGDGWLYLSAGDAGHPIRFNLTTHVYEDLGKISNVLFIWDYCFGNDGNIYGGTSNQSRLIRITPGSGAIADMGRADAVQTNSLSVATGTGNYVYIGVGLGEGKIIAYDTAGATFTDITPVGAPSATRGTVWTGIDGNPYGQIGSHKYSLNGLVATPVGSASADDTLESTLISQTQIDIFDPSTSITYNMDITGYSGSSLPVFQIGNVGSKIYGCSALPAYFFESSGATNTMIERVGNGEVYSMISVDGKLWMGAYASNSPIIMFNPDASVGPDNPKYINYSGSTATWRPSTICSDSNNFIYFGSEYFTNTTEGPLVQLNPYNQTVKTFIVKADQSPLAVGKWNDVIVFGTTVKGNAVPSPPAQDPVLGIFDPSSETSIELDSFPGFAWIENIVIYEDIAIFIALQDANFPDAGNIFFYDLINQNVIRQVRFPWDYGASHSNLLNVEGKIFGISDNGIVFEVDPSIYSVRPLVSTPSNFPETFGRNCINVDGDLYYQKGAEIKRIRSISGLSGWF